MTVLATSVEKLGTLQGNAPTLKMAKVSHEEEWTKRIVTSVEILGTLQGIAVMVAQVSQGEEWKRSVTHVVVLATFPKNVQLPQNKLRAKIAIAADHLIIWLETVQTKVIITPTQK